MEPIWRYLTLAKYVDLLRTASLYFPKASLFQDESEGKWFAHVFLYQRSRWLNQASENAKAVEELLRVAGSDPDRILQETKKLITSNDDIDSSTKSLLSRVERAFPNKRREFLEWLIASWQRQCDAHNQEVDRWRSDLAIIRDSTYISCWNRASTMSLAMWELYGGGREAVAIRSTVGKLRDLIDHNSQELGEAGFEAAVSDVSYVHGLKEPSDEVQQDVDEIIDSAPGLSVAQFSIKPDIYRFEQEVRAIIYPKRDHFKPLEDPHPDMFGYSIPLSLNATQGEASASEFIDAVHVHPTLSGNSMMVQSVREINARFGVDLSIEADPIEALGANVRFPEM